MHHSKDQVFTFIMMVIFSCCTVSINNYSTLYMVNSIPLPFFHIRSMIIFDSDILSPASLSQQNKTLLTFNFLILIMSIQMLEWRQVMLIQYLDINAEFL